MPRILLPSSLTVSKLLESPTEAKDDSHRSQLQWNLEKKELRVSAVAKQRTWPRQRKKGPPVTALTSAQDFLGYFLAHVPWQDPET